MDLYDLTYTHVLYYFLHPLFRQVYQLVVVYFAIFVDVHCLEGLRKPETSVLVRSSCS